MILHSHDRLTHFTLRPWQNYQTYDHGVTLCGKPFDINGWDGHSRSDQPSARFTIVHITCASCATGVIQERW